MQGISIIIAFTLWLMPLASMGAIWSNENFVDYGANSCELCKLDRNTEQRNLLSRDKMNLNSVDVSELLNVPGITIVQANAIINLRRHIGRISSFQQILELSQIDALDLARIREFTYIGNANNSPSGFRQFYATTFLANNGNEEVRKNTEADNTQTLVEFETNNSNGYQFLGQLNNTSFQSTNYDNRTGMIYADTQTGWHEKRLALLKSHQHRFTQASKWVVGHYNLGFAEGLTINTGYKPHSNGIYPFTPFHVNLFSGHIQQRPTLQGIAYQQNSILSTVKLGYTLFASSIPVNLGKKEFTYAPNAEIAARLGPCTSPGTRTHGFVCFPDGQWRSWSLLATSNENLELQVSGIENALQESLFGQQMSLSFSRHHLGLIHYQSTIDTLIDAPLFSPSPYAAYPSDKRLSSSGLYYQYIGSNYVSTEVSQNHNGDVSSVLRWQSKLFWHGESSVSLRKLKSAHGNPHTNSESATDYVYLPSPRNEQGIRVKLSTKWRRFRYQSIYDMWQYSDELDSQGHWIETQHRQLRAYVRQSFTLSLRPLEREDLQLFGLDADWTDQDVRKNGRIESFIGNPDNIHGQRRRMLLRYQSQNTEHLFRCRYVNAWLDTTENNSSFAHQQSLLSDLQWRLVSFGYMQISLFNTLRPLNEGLAREIDQVDIIRQTSLAFGLYTKHQLRVYSRIARTTFRVFDSVQQSEQMETENRLLIQVSYSDFN